MGRVTGLEPATSRITILNSPLLALYMYVDVKRCIYHKPCKTLYYAVYLRLWN